MTNYLARAKAHPSHSLTILIVAVALAVASVAGVMAQALGPAGPSPATGQSSVIAQGVITVPDGPQRWQVSTYTNDPGAEAITIEFPSFVLARSTPLLITDTESGHQIRLANGEAAFLYPGQSVKLETFGPPDGFVFIELTEPDAFSIGNDVLAGDEFQPLAGTRDLDLIRTVLDAGDTATLPAGAGRAVVVGMAGDVSAVGGGVEATILPGDIAEFDGEVTLTGNADGSEIVTAYIGAVVSFGDEPTVETASSPAATPELEVPTEIPATPELVVDEATPEVTPVPTEIPATPPSEGEATPAPTDEMDATPSGAGDASDCVVALATPGAAVAGAPFALIELEGDSGIDSDQDGLSDAREEFYKTGPLSADTDADGINDYRELVDFGTDPILADTDDDGINDYNEVFLFGIDPLNLDTDCDLLYDGGELLWFTDVLNPDTDDDGISDGDEVYFTLTDPTEVDTDGDGYSDFEEVESGSDALDPNSPTVGGRPPG